MGKNNRQIGSKYEQLAADYLKKQGYCIVERNYYTPYGEIDIIAQQDEVLVFVDSMDKIKGKWDVDRLKK